MPDSALENLWRERRQTALDRYHVARDACSKAIADHNQKWSPAGQCAVIEALRSETAAIEEHRRVLKVFLDLVVDGRGGNFLV